MADNASLAGVTAYVLGNGPTLDVDALPRLAGQLTIGTNRILRSGFSPTCIVFNDPEVWRDDEQLFDAYDGLIISNRHWSHNIHDAGAGRITWLPTITGKDMGANPNVAGPRPDRLYINGNSAVGAALLAIAWGCASVRMLGCGCQAVDGRSHFYGPHPGWDERYQIPEDIPTIMRQPLERLCAAYPDAVIVDDTVPAEPTPMTQADMVAAIKAAIQQPGDIKLA